MILLIEVMTQNLILEFKIVINYIASKKNA